MKSENKYRSKVIAAQDEETEKELKRLKDERSKKDDLNALEEVPDESVEEKPKEPPKEVEVKDSANWEKRYADLQRHLQKVKDDHKIELESAKSSGGVTPGDLSEEEFQEWMKKYPVVTQAVNRLAKKVAEDQIGDVKKKLEYVDQMAEVNQRNQALAKLIKAHSDFEELSKSEQFIKWLDEQDEDDKNAIRKPKAWDDAAVNRAARVVKFFKLETGWKVKKEKKDDHSADLVTKTRQTSPDNLDGEPRFTESEVAEKAAQSPKWYSQNREKILAAKRKGPPYFIYDMSGPGD